MTKMNSFKQNASVQNNKLAEQNLAITLSEEDENHQRLMDKARIYMMRCIVRLDALDDFALKREHNFSALAKFVGFYELCEDKESYAKSAQKRKKVFEFCKEKLEIFEEFQKKNIIKNHEILSENLAFLQDSLNLTNAELYLLEYIVMLEEVMMFKKFLSIYENLSARESMMLLAKILNLPYETLQNALKSNATLQKSGILRVEMNRWCNFQYFVEFEDNHFVDILLEKRDDNTLIGEIIDTCEYGTLCKDDYLHLKEFDMLQNYLKKAISQGKKGVNVLFYGQAGTGKTELAKVLAKGANAKIYKVSTKNKDGRVIDGELRLKSYLLAQRLLAPKQSLLLYDEVEDILCFSSDENRLRNKAFINESLESNAVATIWITNNIQSVDRAVIRRFDFILNVKVPKKAHRMRIINKICAQKLDEKAMKIASNAKHLAPAIIERACKVSEQIDGDFSANFTSLVKNTLKASGMDYALKKNKKSEKSKLPQSYSLEFINADCDLQALANGIAKAQNARLCLYGQSGTGKSAFARFLAQKLGRKCLIKAASDLLGAYVGENEKNIAAAFKEARKKNAVLVFDEVDSFLRERSLARQSWEQSLVNEMLVQMEKFNGVFIATTNLMDGLDKACLRRFELKLEFRPLNASQRVKLFAKECEFLGFAFDDELLKSVKRLENLACGDFATVKRQAKFSPLENALNFYERLVDEIKTKDLQGENARAGFVVA